MKYDFPKWRQKQKNNNKFFTKVQGQYLTFAIVLIPLISHESLPLSSFLIYFLILPIDQWRWRNGLALQAFEF